MARPAPARRDAADAVIVRDPHQPLMDRRWELRHDVTPYDAAFLALAQILAVPLITCDGRLAWPAGHRARVKLFEA